VTWGLLSSYAAAKCVEVRWDTGTPVAVEQVFEEVPDPGHLPPQFDPNARAIQVRSGNESWRRDRRCRVPSGWEGAVEARCMFARARHSPTPRSPRRREPTPADQLLDVTTSALRRAVHVEWGIRG